MNDTAVQRRASPLAALFALLCALVIALTPGAAWAADETELTATGGELSSGSYILNEDVTLTTDITIPSGAEVTIDLAGHTLTGTGSGSVITVYGELTLTDSGSGGTVKGGSASQGGGVYVSGGTFTMEGGTISENKASGNGAGVYVISSTFTMEGGTISGNTSTYYGGGVYVLSSTFTMNGGKISGNIATDSFGGGVYVYSSTFTMNGGEVSGNTSLYGAGVYVISSTFTMEGGTISGNTGANYGGGVYVSTNGAFTMNGGEVSGNTVSMIGGGVCVNTLATFTMEGGTISGNTAADSGGGVYVSGDTDHGNATASIKGGNISNNTAASNGGGICVSSHATLTVSGGVISGNKVTSSDKSLGGGIYLGTYGTSLDMSGGIISGNESAYRGGGIYMSSNTSLTISGGTITGNTASATAGGVYLNKGTTFKVTSESVVITDNTAGTNADDLYLAKSASSISITGIAGSWYMDRESSRYGSDGYDYESSIVKMTEISAGTTYPLHSELANSVTITYDANNSSASPASFTQVVTSSSTLADDSVFWLDRCHYISSWNTAADGSGTTYATGASASDIASDIASAGENITLYAQWSESHDYDYDDIEWTWTEATDGSWSATATVACTRCGTTKTIDATVTSETNDATCEEDGSTEYTASITANETTYTAVSKDDVTVAATGHDYDSGVVTVEAWDGAEGTITYTCEVCGGTVTGTFCYYIEEGAGQTVARGEDLVATSETDNTVLGTAYEKFTGLQVDGADLDSSDYTYEEGSVAATISADYLDTLELGEHELTFVYTDGSVSTTFTIEDEAEASEEEAAAEEESSDDGLAGTGDRTAFTVLSIATMGGIALVAGIAVGKRRKA